MAQTHQRWDIFCRVVDNFGDIGISWRLARQLSDEYGLHVRLWVDDMQAASAIIPALRPRLKPPEKKIVGKSAETLTGKLTDKMADDSKAGQPAKPSLSEPVLVRGVMICNWPQAHDQFSAADVGDVVIESLGCELPAQYLAAMLVRKTADRQAVWINLEYLSAEAWVDDFHAKSSLQAIYTQPSPQSKPQCNRQSKPQLNSNAQTPSVPAPTLQKHFFFPGFTVVTGGLIRERQLTTVRNEFQGSASTQQAFWTSLGVEIVQHATRQAARHPRIISLFCYPHAPLSLLLDSLAHAAKPTLCIVPGSSLLPALAAWFGKESLGKESSDAETGNTTPAIMRKGNLSVQVIPFLSQVEYDRLLWACDLNFVRGEDSWVRAIWSGKPFLWQPYQQQEDTHLTKLHAFLDLYCDGLDPHTGNALRNAHVAWCNNRDSLERDSLKTEPVALEAHSADLQAGPAGLKTSPAGKTSPADLQTNPSATKPSAVAFEHALATLTTWATHSRRMSQRLAKQGDLAAKLVNFCRNQL